MLDRNSQPAPTGYSDPMAGFEALGKLAARDATQQQYDTPMHIWDVLPYSDLAVSTTYDVPYRGPIPDYWQIYLTLNAGAGFVQVAQSAGGPPLLIPLNAALPVVGFCIVGRAENIRITTDAAVSCRAQLIAIGGYGLQRLGML